MREGGPAHLNAQGKLSPLFLAHPAGTIMRASCCSCRQVASRRRVAESCRVLRLDKMLQFSPVHSYTHRRVSHNETAGPS